MIDVKIYGSSSAGNCYEISCNGRSLLLETGVPFKKLTNSNFNNFDGCLISHEHGDHIQYAHQFVAKTGIDLYMSKGTHEGLEDSNFKSVPSYRVKHLKALNQRKIVNWNILPFDTQHDVNEPLGFLIQSEQNDKILFATDTYYIKYNFKGITHMLIECNYAMDILEKNMEMNRVNKNVGNRVITSHFELSNVKKFIKSCDLSKLQAVWLLHLSDSNSNAERFKREIQAITGVPVYIA